MYRCIILFVIMLLLSGGCDSDKSRLTDAQVERLAITQKIELVEAAGGFVLMVGGETLSSDEIIETRTQLNGMFVSPIDYFGPIAKANEFEQFKERAQGQLEDMRGRCRTMRTIPALIVPKEGCLFLCTCDRDTEIIVMTVSKCGS